MKNTTLCYLEQEGNYLMLHRVKKENDANHDKWIGIGGKFEDKESPEDCALREIREETGLNLQPEELRYRGIVTFVSDRWETEYMHLVTASVPEGLTVPEENDEGLLEWVPKDRITALPIWEGDKVFLNLLGKETPFFSLKLIYEGEKLAGSILY